MPIGRHRPRLAKAQRRFKTDSVESPAVLSEESAHICSMTLVLEKSIPIALGVAFFDSLPVAQACLARSESRLTRLG